MNILIVGSGKGSWAMRGEQLGTAIGARVRVTPSADDWGWANLVVLVKRAVFGAHVADAHRYGLPITWDALDFWQQPGQNGLDAVAARGLLASILARVRPALVIGATEAMARDAAGVCLPHHAWSGLAPTPTRQAVQAVGYEGNPTYLGCWHGLLQRACAARGWQFVVNPPHLGAVDLLVALRDGCWDGWMCREWKSGVKVVNAIAAGRPLISQDCAAVRELQPAGSIIASPDDLDGALDAWAGRLARQAVVDASIARVDALSLESVAHRYRSLLEDVGVAACS